MSEGNRTGCNLPQLSKRSTHPLIHLLVVIPTRLHLRIYMYVRVYSGTEERDREMDFRTQTRVIDGLHCSYRDVANGNGVTSANLCNSFNPVNPDVNKDKKEPGMHR